MAVENLKATPITDLDATPVVRHTAGLGAPGVLQNVGGFVTVSASASLTSTYRLARIPSYAIVKNVWFEAAAMGAGKFNLSAFFSDAANDGTTPANQGVIVPTTGDQFWAADIDCASAVLRTNEVGQSGNYSVDKRDKHLWDALGLTSDPGGFIDVVAVVHTTAVTTGAAKIRVEVDFIA